MLLRVALFVVMAFGLIGFGTVAWISTHPAAPPTVAAVAVAPPATAKVLVAARTLRAGALLKPDDLTTKEFAPDAVPVGASLDTSATRAELLGAMLRRTVVVGDVLLPPQVMRAGDRGFLAAVLDPGMRATTVGVDAVTGTAGLIWPGDHVDLILTETLDEPGAPLGRRIAGETVLHNVRVIAIDQELMQGATAPTLSGVPPPQARTVTLEVTPANAERVAVATRLGHLSLSVISADAPDTSAPAQAPPPTAVSAVEVAAHAPVTWGSDVSAALQTGRQAGPVTNSLRVYEGSAEGKEIHF